MAKIGLSYPCAATYTFSSGSITYSNFKVIGKAVSLELSLEDAGENMLYADNTIAESDNQFGGGTITLNTDSLDAAVLSSLLGLIEDDLPSTIDVDTTNVKVVHFDDRQTTPTMGFGGIVKLQRNGATKWMPIFFTKVTFQNPNESFTTQGQTIEWGTHEISAKLDRDDSTNHEWQKRTSVVDSEADAKIILHAWMGNTTT